jgi:hypothetical protein
MNDLIIILLLIVLILIFFITNDRELMSVPVNDSYVLVRKMPDYRQSAQLLYDIINNLYILREHLIVNQNNYPEIKDYILFMEPNFHPNRTKIYENALKSSFTSYCVNKGEELVFCLRHKPTLKLHNLNLMMYVAIHEMAHTACPENGHPPLFVFIFREFLLIGKNIGLYTYEDYTQVPVNYCGMELNSNVLN